MNGHAGRARALSPQGDMGTLCLLPGECYGRYGYTFGPLHWASLPKCLQTKPKPPRPWVSKPHAWLPASSQIQAATPHTPPCLSRGHVWLRLPGRLKPVVPGKALEAATLEVKSCGEVQVAVTSGEAAQSVDHGVIIAAGC